MKPGHRNTRPQLDLGRRFRHFVRARLKASGPRWIVRRVWEKEFAEGGWDFLEDTEGDCVYPLVERYCRGGSILDLGCGSGNTGNELRWDAYATYIGVDLSDTAVGKAIQRTQQNGRSEKNQYLQGDICSYGPTGHFDVILFRECIWNVPRSRLQEVLDRCRGHLAPSGVMIVRIYDRVKFKDLVRRLINSCELVEEYAPGDIKDIVLVLR